MSGFKILFANLYDILLLLAIWFAAAVPFVLWQGEALESSSAVTLALQIYIIAITYVYLTYFWTQSGQTPGLRTWKLQLVTEDNRILSRHTANMRFIFTVLFFLIGWIGLFLPKKQLLQDQFAKTKIIAVEQN